MKFDALLEMNHPELAKKVNFNEKFLKHVLEMGTDHYDFLISSIMSVTTDNKINNFGQTQGAGAAFKHEPLLGLYKTHCLDISLKSRMMNVPLHEYGLEVVESPSGECDIDFTQDESKRLSKLEIEGDLLSHIENYSNEISNSIQNDYKKRQSKQKITGNWLIYGKRQSENIFLYLAVGYDHSINNDKIIYDSLVNIYSEDFIKSLKSGK